MNANEPTFVVGTAGHVDHGKSTLVERLTGIDPDRLQQEKEREMTIDLGFAWLALPGGTRVSIVDVPGHERFIKNMLAGVGGIDAAMLVVAADEGPMPQTKEHLAIIDLLGIDVGVVVLSKSDLVDEEWLELVELETSEILAESTLRNAPIIPVSSTTGEGLPELVSTLEQLLLESTRRRRTGRPRLSVDRVFTVSGFGTVITGTLLGDILEIGQEIEFLPSGLRSRIRGLQVHGQRVEQAAPGARTAVNMTGIDRHEIVRGSLLTTPGWIEPTSMLDARLRLIPEAPKVLEQNDAVDLFIGAAEASAHVTLLNDEFIQPGDEAWVQIRTDQPIAAVEGDLFIIRQASPSLTIGGGVVVDPMPKRHRRFRDRVIRDLETRMSGTPTDRLIQAVGDGSPTIRILSQVLEIDLNDIYPLVTEALQSGRLVALSDDGLNPRSILLQSETFMRLSDRIATYLGEYHARYPLRIGVPKQELRSQLRVEQRTFEALISKLVKDGRLEDQGDAVSNVGFEITLTRQQCERADRFVQRLLTAPNSPPAPSEFDIDQELLGALDSRGSVVRVSENVVFSPVHLKKMEEETLRLIDEHGDITLARFRDHFGSSRKYAQAVLEYFDQKRITRRVGDVRVRGRG